MYTNPTVADFVSYFNRDFPYGNTDLTTVNDVDITKALDYQQNTINQTLFPNQNIYSQGALLLAAHQLVLNLRASSQGIAGKFEWLQQSKGVGAVNAAFAIPQRLLDNPEFAAFAGTTYGTQYLMLILPFLTGNMFSVYGPRPAGYGWFGGSTGPWGGPTGPQG